MTQASPETLDQYSRQLRLTIWLFAVCVLLSVVASGLSALGFAHTATRFAEVTSGDVLNVKPVLPSSQIGARVGAFCVFFIHLAGEIAFLVAMTKMRRLAEILIGQSVFRWSWRWTIGSCFIPLLNLVRPWIGFAELHALVKAALAGRQAETHSRRWYLSAATYALWFSFILLCLDRFAIHVVSYGLMSAIRNHGDILGQYRSLAFQFKIDAVVITWTGGHVLLYVTRLRRRLLRLAAIRNEVIILPAWFRRISEIPPVARRSG